MADIAEILGLPALRFAGSLCASQHKATRNPLVQQNPFGLENGAISVFFTRLCLVEADQLSVQLAVNAAQFCLDTPL